MKSKRVKPNFYSGVVKAVSNNLVLIPDKKNNCFKLAEMKK